MYVSKCIAGHLQNLSISKWSNFTWVLLSSLIYSKGAHQQLKIKVFSFHEKHTHWAMHISLRNKKHTSGRNYTNFDLWCCTYMCFPTGKCKILERRDGSCSDFSLNQGFCVPSRRLGSAGAGQPLIEKTPQGRPVKPPLQVLHRA